MTRQFGKLQVGLESFRRPKSSITPPDLAKVHFVFKVDFNLVGENGKPGKIASRVPRVFVSLREEERPSKNSNLEGTESFRDCIVRKKFNI